VKFLASIVVGRIVDHRIRSSATATNTSQQPRK
jgi:hypothetical protein